MQLVLLDPYILEHLLSLFALVRFDADLGVVAGAHVRLRLVVEQLCQ